MTAIHDYTVEVRRRDGIFYLSIPELGLVSSGGDIGQAYRDLEARQNELFDHCGKTQTLGRLPPPRDVQRRRELVPFFIKAATVVLVGSILLSVASLSFVYAIHGPLQNRAQKLTRLAINQMIAGLDKAATSEITPERDEKIREAIRKIVPRLKPYADELRPLFETGNKAQ